RVHRLAAVDDYILSRCAHSRGQVSGSITKGAIPMDIVFSSTTQLAAAIRAGHVSATEVLQAHLAQIARHNPALNAIITMDAEQARKRAHEADESLTRGEVWGPLHGVPFTLKDAHATAGM